MGGGGWPNWGGWTSRWTTDLMVYEIAHRPSHQRHRQILLPANLTGWCWLVKEFYKARIGCIVCCGDCWGCPHRLQPQEWTAEDGHRVHCSLIGAVAVTVYQLVARAVSCCRKLRWRLHGSHSCRHDVWFNDASDSRISMANQYIRIITHVSPPPTQQQGQQQQRAEEEGSSSKGQQPWQGQQQGSIITMHFSNSLVITSLLRGSCWWSILAISQSCAVQGTISITTDATQLWTLKHGRLQRGGIIFLVNLVTESQNKCRELYEQAAIRVPREHG